MLCLLVLPFGVASRWHCKAHFYFAVFASDCTEVVTGRYRCGVIMVKLYGQLLQKAICGKFKYNQ